MTPPPDLAKCINCDCWFAAAAPDELFLHATATCRREKSEPPAFTDPSPARNAFTK